VPTSKVCYCNLTFESLTGYGVAEILGQPYRFLEGPDTDANSLAELRSAFDKTQEAQIVIKNYRKNGSAFWNQIKLSPIKNQEGKITHLIGIHKDVTAQYEAQANATRLGVIMESVDNEIYIVDEKTLKILHANQTAVNNMGYSLEELSELTALDIKPDLSHKFYINLAAELRNNNVIRQFSSTRLTRKDGSTYMSDMSLQLAKYQNSSVFIALAMDTTVQRKTEAELEQNLKILESAPDPTIVFDDTGDIKMVNSQYEKFSGFALKELHQSHIDKLVARRNSQTFSQTKKKLESLKGAANPILKIEMLAHRSADNAVPVDVTICPELAEKTAQTKSLFFAAASHDLRQPLQSLSMYLSVLEQQDQLPGEAVELCQSAAKSLGSMSRLLAALLESSDLASGNVIAQKQDVSILEILDNVVTVSKPHADKKGLLISCQSAEYIIHTDPALLERIIENIVMNAIQYTDKGFISIKCECQQSKIGDRSGDKELRISITDSGHGIPQDKQEKIFEEYFQLDNAERNSKKGLGLGLSNVKNIARLLECPIELSSSVGVGTTFSIAVPLGVAKSVNRAEVVTALEGQEDTLTVLVVDDDESVAKSTARLLTVFEMNVHTAVSGDEALGKIAQGLKPDVIVSDFRLPRYDGIELIERVRSALRSELPAIIMSGDTSSEKIKQAMLPNFIALSKPVDPERLCSLIQDGID